MRFSHPLLYTHFRFSATPVSCLWASSLSGLLAPLFHVSVFLDGRRPFFLSAYLLCSAVLAMRPRLQVIHQVVVIVFRNIMFFPRSIPPRVFCDCNPPPTPSSVFQFYLGFVFSPFPRWIDPPVVGFMLGYGVSWVGLLSLAFLKEFLLAFFTRARERELSPFPKGALYAYHPNFLHAVSLGGQFPFFPVPAFSFSH